MAALGMLARRRGSHDRNLLALPGGFATLARGCDNGRRFYRWCDLGVACAEESAAMTAKSQVPLRLELACKQLLLIDP